MPGGRLSDSTTAGYGSDLVVDLLHAVGVGRACGGGGGAGLGYGLPAALDTAEEVDPPWSM